MFSDEYTATSSNYKMLVNAVIQKAAEDYIAAYKVWNTFKIEELERFFRGQEFLLYTDGKIDPEYIIKELRRKARR